MGIFVVVVEVVDFVLYESVGEVDWWDDGVGGGVEVLFGMDGVCGEIRRWVELGYGGFLVVEEGE